MLQPDYFFDLTDFEHRALFADTEYVWDALKRLPKYLEDNLQPGVHCTLPPGVVVGEDVFIGAGTIVEPQTYIMGPTIIGPGCHIRQGAYIRGNVLVGDEAIVGHCTEVKGSILLPRAAAPHFNYVGDAIIGRRANMGAGSILSNFKLTGDEIVVEVDGKQIPTGLNKFGGVLGDGTQIGCNAVLNPGTMLGPRCIVYPGASVRGYYPAETVIKLRQANEVAERKGR
jgi:UDP-N-acetylglucosamine diphosphorylase / glucose-1-phosphate thymidylyltransferase / UDP-N-acetylgalactosamine diphosphorylase / glucosamine-1-phosphate N-acetyltransferase / galactosamine-1-phosphate N-acetyltransferase